VQLVQVQSPELERPYAGDRGVRYRSTRVALGDFLITISSYGEANPFFRAMRRMAGWRGVSWLYARILPTADRLVSRLSGRKLTLVAITTGLPVLLLTTIGAKTGALRVNPVLYLRSGEDFVVIASNWGQRHNPGWYYNLLAHPKATVTLDGATFDALAREATAPERDLFWAQAVRMYPAWNIYKARALRREFPILPHRRSAWLRFAERLDELATFVADLRPSGGT
jgi:deazaflavin-dependent oxidoreductase (nitroreductase family)